MADQMAAVNVDGVEERRKRTIRLLGAVACAGLLASAFHSVRFGFPRGWSILATAIVLASGSAMGGGLIGFLFALPRGRRIEPGPPDSAALPASATADPTTEPSEREASTRPNTNLDDISDWLTKILVGVGLTQLASIGGALGRLSRAVAPSLGGPESAAFGLGLLLTFVSTGFFMGYLWTRFYIPVAFERAESDVRAELRALRKQTVETRASVDEFAAYSGRVVEATTSQVQEQVTQAFLDLGHPPPVAEPLESAVERARSFAGEYERIRSSMSRGPARTFEMSRIVSRMRDAAKTLRLNQADLQELFEARPGGRVVALTLIAEQPDIASLDLVTSGITHSQSAFEQNIALRAARSLVETASLSLAQRRELEAAIRTQMGTGPEEHIRPNSERSALAEAVLEQL